MIMYLFCNVISRVQFKYTKVMDIKKNVLGNDTSLCITCAVVKKKSS